MTSSSWGNSASAGSSSWFGDSTITSWCPIAFHKYSLLNDLFFVFRLFGWTESWVEVWDNADKPVFWSFPNQRVLATLYFAVFFLVKHYGWRRHVFVANAHGANRGFGGFRFGFGEVGGSSAAFSGDYNPAVKQVIFSKFVVRHIRQKECWGILAFLSPKLRRRL